MKRYNVIYTRDGVTYKSDIVEAENKASAYVKFELSHDDGDCIESISLSGGCI